MRFDGRFISDGDHIFFVREADIEVFQLFGRILERAFRGFKRDNNLLLPIKLAIKRFHQDQQEEGGEEADDDRQHHHHPNQGEGGYQVHGGGGLGQGRGRGLR